jgi:hypothetical protein
MPAVNVWPVERNVATSELATTPPLHRLLWLFYLRAAGVGARVDKAGPLILNFGYAPLVCAAALQRILSVS